MAFNTLSAGPGVELSYIDSGAPASHQPYTTIVAIHGMCFSNLIFEKMLPVSFEKGTRFVALNRRHYPGSTEYSSEELGIVMSGGTEEQKDAELQARGVEIATFIDNLILKNNLSPMAQDNKDGGIILLGWSIGSAHALATIASAHALPSETRARLGAHIKSVIIYDPAPIVLGLPTPEQNWTPLLDTYVPEGLRLAAFGQWATGYFDHGDLAKRDLSSLSWVLPSASRIPTFFNIPAEKFAEVSRYGNDGFSDLLYMIHFMPQFKAVYRKVLNDPEMLNVFPSLKLALLVGEKSGAFAIAGMWAIEDDLKQSNGSKLKINLVSGINHFVRKNSRNLPIRELIMCSSGIGMTQKALSKGS
ncbi:hypothetical protein C0992_001969 [Termitomyces sp. T32_za158]|nr:hypothetical protein C0992_001969 [Termitomyces sp. T32_za158]